MRGGVKGEGETGVSFEEASSLARAGPGVLKEEVGQVRQAGGDHGRCRVSGSPPDGLKQAGPAVAEAGIDDAAELSRVGQAIGEGMFGYLLA